MYDDIYSVFANENIERRVNIQLHFWTIHDLPKLLAIVQLGSSAFLRYKQHKRRVSLSENFGTEQYFH